MIYLLQNREKRRGLMSLVGGLLIMICLGTVYSWSVFRIPVQEAYDIKVTASGLPYMVSLASYAVSMLLSGRYLQKMRARHALWLGSLLVASGWILASFSGSILTLTISYGLLMGVGVGIAYGIPMEAAANWFPQNKGLAVGIVLVGFGMSPLVTAPLVRLLLEEVGLHRSFLTLGIVFLVVMPLVSLLVDTPGRQRNKVTSPQDAKSSMTQSPSFVFLYLTFLIATTIGLMTIGMTSVVATRYVGMTVRKSALFMGLFAVCNGLGRPLFGHLTDRWGAKRMARLSYLLIVLASLLMLISEKPNFLIFSVSFSLFWLNLGGWLAIAPTTTMGFYGSDHYPRNYGILFTAYGVGAVLGVLLSGMVLDLIGSLRLVFFLVLILALSGAFLAKGLHQ